MSDWMIYGANGYTGELMVAEAVRRGLNPILAGRNADVLQALGSQHRLPVRIFGLEHSVLARVETVHTFSAHADREDLMWFMKALDPRPRTIFLVHGENQDRAKLTEHLKAEGITHVASPNHGDVVELD